MVGKSVLISSRLRMALEGKRHASGNQLEVDLVVGRVHDGQRGQAIRGC